MENNKQYRVIFNIWSPHTFSEEKKDFDTNKEWKEYVELIEDIYENTEPTTDRFGDEKKWGYVVLDMKYEKILKWSKNGEIYNLRKTHNKLALKDKFFRKPGEIPENYKWDDGEYSGWLQFRWGDGKNAIDYVEKKTSSKSNEFSEINEELMATFEDDIQDRYNDKLVSEKVRLKMDRW